MLVVHDRAEAWALADRLIVLLDGRIAAARPSARGARGTADGRRWPGSSGSAGELRDGDGVLLTRPSQVHLDPAGDITATVVRLIPLEDGARAELDTPDRPPVGAGPVSRPRGR